MFKSTLLVCALTLLAGSFASAKEIGKWSVLKSFTVKNTLDYQGPQTLTFRPGPAFSMTFGSQEINEPCLFNCSENKKHQSYLTFRSQAGEISFKVQFAKTREFADMAFLAEDSGQNFSVYQKIDTKVVNSASTTLYQRCEVEVYCHEGGYGGGCTTAVGVQSVRAHNEVTYRFGTDKIVSLNNEVLAIKKWTDDEPYTEQKVEEGSEGECHLNINKK